MAQDVIDDRIRKLIEISVITGHRSLFVIIGKRALDNVVILHEMLSKADVKRRPPVLWCYKNLEFPTSKTARKKLKQERGEEADPDKPIEHFINSAHIKYCSYSDTKSIVGRISGMAILQDFEALTPNLLARIVETIAGGGIVIILLQTLKSLRQLCTMAMDAHAHYRTEAYQDIAYRFNERFVLSLTCCSDCLVVDDQLNILPTSSSPISIRPLPPENEDRKTSEKKFSKLKEDLNPSEPIGNLIKACRTYDQAKAMSGFIEALCQEHFHSTVVLTSAKGRGKSVALGFAVAAAIECRYNKIIIAAENPECTQTVFESVANGLNKLGYEKYVDYEEIKSSDFTFCASIVQINVKKHWHLQTVSYYDLTRERKLGKGIDLLVIDEAATIPFSYVQRLLGPYIVFMSATINGYERSGRCHTLKLKNQLRKHIASRYPDQPSEKNYTGRVLHEIFLNEPIRYCNGDQVEYWLNRLLCLDVTVPTPKLKKFPEASDCKLYCVNRDMLFNYTMSSEKFLRKLISILMASQYKNSPDELLVMADAPAHRIFCLCAPSSKELPEILCVLHVCYEGKLAESTVRKELIKERRESCHMFPLWAILREDTKELFIELSGVRIVQIATHPAYQKKGYGSYAVKLLQEFHEGKFFTDRSNAVNVTPVVMTDDDSEPVANLVGEKLEPRTSFPPLLYGLEQIRPKVVDYLVVSYGITEDLLKFWKKAGFCTAYLSPFTNQNGEHTCVMFKQLTDLTTSRWLSRFWIEVCESLLNRLPMYRLSVEIAIQLICYPPMPAVYKDLSKMEVFNNLNSENIKVLRDVCHNDMHEVPDHLVRTLAKFYFTYLYPHISLEKNERIMLFAYGVIQKLSEDCCRRLNMDVNEVYKIFRKAFVKVAQVVLQIVDQCEH